MATLVAIPNYPVFEIEEYFDREESSAFRNEFYYGHVYAKAGGSGIHSLIASNLAYLRPKLSAHGCFILGSDFQIVTPQANAVFYPDASVVCGKSALDLGQRSATPQLILEVLSPSTRLFDLNDKRSEYQRIPSLRYLLFADSQTVAVQFYARNESGEWPESPLFYADAEGAIAFDAWNAILPLADLYRDTGLL
jgi:Uma2 family endonuclease